jgi:hypothetical protein
LRGKLRDLLAAVSDASRLFRARYGYVTAVAMNGPDHNVNPYQSPAVHRADAAAGNPLMIPAIIMLVLASLMLALILGSMPGQILRMRAIDTSTPEGQGELTGMIAALVAWIVMMAGIIWGSIAMLRLRGYRNAMVAAVLAMIPVCSPCFVLGIPFGIWAIIVLMRPEVRARFQ